MLETAINNTEYSVLLYVASAFLIVAVFITLILITPYAVTRYNKYRSQQTKESEKLYNFGGDEENQLIDYDQTNPQNPQISYVIDYNNRKNQLSVGLSSIKLPIAEWNDYIGLFNAKIFVLIYLDGDDINSPCFSQSKMPSTNTCINEIFIFNVKPYDLQNIRLKMKFVLIKHAQMYNVGELDVSINDVDINLYNLNQTAPLNDLIKCPDQYLEQNMLCLSMTCFKNYLKIKIVRLRLIETTEESSNKNSNIAGIYVNFSINFKGDKKTISTTKKKYKNILFFNEVFVIEDIDNLETEIDMEIELNEIKVKEDDNENMITNVFGRLNKSIREYKESYKKLLKHFNDCNENLDTEIIRWHFIPYCDNI